MRTGSEIHTLAIGEVAQRLGLSVRALRLYEQAGLVTPARNAGGRRVYAAPDLARLQLVCALKRAGYTLAAIGRLLARRAVDPAVLLDLQISALESERNALAGTIQMLHQARARLDGSRTMSLEDLCDLIRAGDRTVPDAAWQTVFDQYYSAEDQDRWRNLNKTIGADPAGFQKSWTDLIARVESLIAGGCAPDDPKAMALAIEWHALQRPMIEQVGPEVWAKASRMYQDMDQWQTDRLKAPFSSAVFQFVTAAGEAARNAGLIAPRAASPVPDAAQEG